MGIEMLALRRDPLHACVRLPAWGSAESINGPTDSLGTRGMDSVLGSGCVSGSASTVPLKGSASSETANELNKAHTRKTPTEWQTIQGLPLENTSLTVFMRQNRKKRRNRAYVISVGSKKRGDQGSSGHWGF